MRYKRVLIKISGQIMRKGTTPVDMEVVHLLAQQIVEVSNKGAEVAIVVGAGNLFRGAQLAEQGMGRITCDQVGMISTNINALILQEVIEAYGLPCQLMSALPIKNILPEIDLRRAKQHLSDKEVVIFAGGTGNALVTTDTAASLRAIEVEADILLKGTRVDGVYSADPETASDAVRYDSLSYDEVISQSLAVMDQSAFRLCQEFALPVCVFNIQDPKALPSIIDGQTVGTMIRGDE